MSAINTAQSHATLTRTPLWQRRPWWVWVVTACVLYIPFLSLGGGQGNVASDLAAIESLVERHTFFINESGFNTTIDKFRRPDGQFFSQKSPIFHLIGAIPYAALYKAGFSLRANLGLCLSVLTLVLTIIPMGLLLWVIDHHPWMAALTARRRGLVVVLFGVGSLLTPFAVTLNHYTGAALFMTLASAALARGWPAVAAAGRRPPSGPGLHPTRMGWVGFWLAASLACDVPPAFLALVILAAALFGGALLKPMRARWQALGWLVLGAAPLLLLYAGLNLRILGSVLPPNLHESEMLYYPGSYWSELRDAAARGEPNYYQRSYPLRLWHATLGHKGLYWMMPLLVIATIAAVQLWRRRAPGWPLAVFAALFPLLAVAVTMRWAFDLSGGAYNIRHVIATTPLLFCVLGHSVLVGWRERWRVALQVATAWGVLIGMIGMINPWSQNTLSAYPPLQVIGQWCLAHGSVLPTEWIGGLINRTSTDPWNGWVDLGRYYWMREDYERAAAAMRRATQVRPDRPLAFYHLGVLEAKCGRLDLAIKTYDQLLKLEPENVGAWNNSGFFAYNLQLLDRAEESFQHALKLAPEHPRALLGLLMVMEARGLADPRAPLLDHALRHYPADDELVELARRWRGGLQHE